MRRHFEESLPGHGIVIINTIHLIELMRTKLYNYSLFNLDIPAIVCRIASETDNASKNLRRFTLPNGKPFKKAVDLMYPFIKNKKLWPYRQAWNTSTIYRIGSQACCLQDLPIASRNTLRFGESCLPIRKQPRYSGTSPSACRCYG